MTLFKISLFRGDIACPRWKIETEDGEQYFVDEIRVGAPSWTLSDGSGGGRGWIQVRGIMTISNKVAYIDLPQRAC